MSLPNMINSGESVLLIPEGILDLKENRILKGKALAVREGEISALLSLEQVPVWAKQHQGEIISLAGLTLMPGLVDCHVHFALDSVDFKQCLARWPDQNLIEQQTLKFGRHLLQKGILAVRDGGDLEGIGLEAKRRLRPGLLVKATGHALRRKGLYGTFLGGGVDTAEEGKKQIRELAASGVDQIKIVVSGIVSFSQYEKVGPLHFSLAELQELVEESHTLGLKVMAHVNSVEGVARAVDAGVDSVEHGYFISDTSLELMEKKGIAWVPTIIPVAAQTREPCAKAHDWEGLHVIEKTYLRHMTQVKKAASLGVPLGVGTDAGAIGAPHGSSYYEEIALYHAAGLSHTEILKAAIFTGAKIIGLDPNWGRMEPGSPAYLIAVQGNPLQDLSSLKRVERIVIPAS
ncbi:amidohydrolase family protein [Dehalobacterium formicoaceticum]|uniref:Amidohydrolase family protein n=1 Tax=Dehalobacterium formicoaceticum TaxID=51515 RepID=A0ABT1Y2Q1_9FIRM|nr:amidohydrolase family protein [Dehalobacterium formicoaceticum]MCR6544435.1 amidohydrolase family protein [Dehalobacterium formicoaceticum]